MIGNVLLLNFLWILAPVAAVGPVWIIQTYVESPAACDAAASEIRAGLPEDTTITVRCEPVDRKDDTR